MNTDTNANAGVNPAITEADVVAFLTVLQKQATESTAEARAKAGITSPRVLVYVGRQNPWAISAYNDKWDSIAGVGKTFAEALTNLEKTLTTQPTADKLRADAAALIAKADKIEKEAAK